MRPNGEANRFERLRLELRLGEQAAKKTRKDVAAAALREKCVAAGIDEYFAVISADQGLVTF